jgi:diguanylate cyclase (GGDEF)-like protein/PAS domain S-box-containing protein
MDNFFSPSNYSFSLYALPLLAVGGLSAVYGFAVLIRERASTVSLALLGTTLATDAWLLSFGAIYSTRDASVAYDWFKIEHIGVCLIPATVYLFTAAVTGRLRSLWPFALGAVLISSVFYALIVSTNWFIVGIHHYYWGYYPLYGWPILPFIAFFGLVLGSSLRVYRTTLRQAGSDTMRRRLESIWLALVIADLASVDYLPAFHIPVYPFGYVFIGAFMFVANRAIWRYRLMDMTPAFAANEIVETMADGLLVLDRDGVIRTVNSAAAALLGASRESLLGLSAVELDSTWFNGALHGLLAPEALHSSEITYQRLGGKVRTALVSTSAVRDKFGGQQGTVCIIHDITQRKAAEEAVRVSEALYRTLVETSPDAVIVAEQGGRVLMANRRAAELAGYEEPDDLRERNAMEFVAPHDRERLSESFGKASGSIVIRDVEYALVTQGGALLPVELSISRIPGSPAESGPIMAVAKDISERKRAEETIRYLAFHDPLTGIANRPVLIDHLGKAMAQARRDGHMLALLFLDLDRFKEINDTAGHAAGDEVLRQVAAKLLPLVREGDTLARVGGDEFVLLLPRLDDQGDATAVAERVLSGLREVQHADRHRSPITGSVGIALYPLDGADAETLLRNADAAMYRAKSGGGDCLLMARNLQSPSRRDPRRRQRAS